MLLLTLRIAITSMVEELKRLSKKNQANLNEALLTEELFGDETLINRLIEANLLGEQIIQLEDDLLNNKIS